MVVPDSEMTPHGEVESPLRQDQHMKNHPFPSLGRQTSIYSLTLDEFQHTLSESGKNFGSMNMDEFLNSIWTAEEHQAQAQTHATTNDDYANMQLLPGGTPIEHKPIVKELSLSRQGSLTLPAPLCRKTVDEVWSEIHRNQHEQQQNGGGGGSGSSSSNVQNPGTSQRQPTFGEMTLEDFLVKAGVVREQCNPPPPPAQPPAYGVYPNNHHPGVGPSFSRPVMGGCGGGVSIPAYPSLPQAGESSMYNGERSRGYPQAPQPPVNYGGRVGSGGGGYGQVQGMGMGSPVSPLSDGVGVGQPDGANQYGMEMGGMRGGRKRIIDGPVEKVVERRQRRMIKNRESAARSRARKQAYTVELEAELNQLKEENAQLKQALAELERKRKQQMWCNLMALFHAEYFEEAKMKSLTKAQRAKERMRIMRRSLSCPL